MSLLMLADRSVLWGFDRPGPVARVAQRIAAVAVVAAPGVCALLAAALRSA